MQPGPVEPALQLDGGIDAEADHLSVEPDLGPVEGSPQRVRRVPSQNSIAEQHHHER